MCELGFQGLQVTVRVNMHPCASGQTHSVDQRRMVQRFRKNRCWLARGGQCRRDRQIGHVAAAKEQRAATTAARSIVHIARTKLGANERCQLVLQRLVCLAVPADEVRGPTACTVQPCTLRQRLDHGRVVGQPQVVVRAKREAFGAVQRDVRAAGGLGRPQAAAQVLGIELGDACFQGVDQMHGVAVMRAEA